MAVVARALAVMGMVGMVVKMVCHGSDGKIVGGSHGSGSCGGFGSDAGVIMMVVTAVLLLV